MSGSGPNERVLVPAGTGAAEGAPDAEQVVVPVPQTGTPEASPLVEILSRGPARATLMLLGPAFVASVAYVDPGNFATNFQAGSQHGYLLVWVVVMANLMAMLVQYLSSKIGLATGRSLPEMCRELYPRSANVILWLQGEVVAMATDLAEFTGAAIGLNLVFGVPLFLAGLITAVIAFGILALQQHGYRRFETAIIALLAFVAAGFIVDFVVIGRESWSGIANGLVPRLGGGNTVSLTVGIVGATVMPHVVYLHSSLQADRIRPRTRGEGRKLLAFNRLDCTLGLGLAGLVNVAMICIAAALFHHPGLTGVTTLGAIHSHLASLVGGFVALCFGVALIASGVASSSVGTYAGQVVMSGFMGWRLPLYIRRGLTMLPSLIVLAISVNTTQVLVISQIILSFGIPFALVPLVLITRRRDAMGYMVNARLTTVTITLVTAIISGLNVYLVVNTL